MNKLLLTAGIAMTTLLGASAMIPQTVQGRPYAPAKGKVSKAWGPDPIPIVDFDFADIQAWAGEGDKKCAFVIQWSDEDEENALMFGYRWSGEATGVDVAKAVVEMHPKLFGAFSDGGSYGTTIDGFGWDGNDDGHFSVTLSNGNVVEAGSNGLMQGGAASYDGSSATDEGDRWHGGWYEGYWSYWTYNPGDDNFSYSQVGASGRNLEDGCIDGWIFAPNLATSPWKEWVAAPAPQVTSVKVGDVVSDDLFKYTVTSTGDVCEVEATQFLRPGDAINVVMSPQVKIEGVSYAVTSIGDNLFSNTPVTGISFPNTLRSIGSYAFSNCSGINSLVLPGSLEEIGVRAFQEMSNLTEIDIPTSVSEIPDNAFYGCTELSKLGGADNVTRIGVGAFMNCAKLATLGGCAKVTVLDRFSLFGCSAIETLPIMPELQKIDNCALGNCMSLKYVVLPESIVAYGLTEIFGSNGNPETVVYTCAETPAKQTGIYTFALGKDNSKPYLDDGIYGAIYVPYGMMSNYNAMPWSLSTIKQLTPKVALTEHEENLDHDNLTCSLMVVNDGIEEADVPELFLEANDLAFAAANVAKKLDFQYRKAGENALFESPVTVADDNTCSVEVRDLPLGKYEYRWTNEKRAAKDEPIAKTEWKPFEVTVKSGVGLVEVESGAVEYYTLQGIRVHKPEPGVYLKRRSGKVTKVTIQPNK